MLRRLSQSLFLMLISLGSTVSLGLGNPEYIPATGTLVLKAVDINGVKTYENVELQLDMQKGTFRIVKASPANNKIPETAIAEVTLNGVTVGLRGCEALDRSVTCHFIFTSPNVDRNFKFYGNQNNGASGFVDNKGNTYLPAEITWSNSSGFNVINKTLVANIPTAATLRVDNVAADATGISFLAVVLDFGTNSNCLFSQCQEHVFRDVKF